MKGSSRFGQRGISFLGLLFVGVVIACVVLVGLKVLPTYIEYLAIEKAAKKAATDGTTVAEVQASFDRTAAVDNIDTIVGKDLEITKDGDRIVVRFAYERELLLFGPAYLLLKYSGQSDK